MIIELGLQQKQLILNKNVPNEKNLYYVVIKNDTKNIRDRQEQEPKYSLQVSSRKK